MAPCMLSSKFLVKFRFCNTVFTKNRNFSQKWDVGNCTKLIGTPHSASSNSFHQQLQIDEPCKSTCSIETRLNQDLFISNTDNRNENAKLHFSRAFRPQSRCSGEYLLKSKKGSLGNSVLRHRKFSEDRGTDKVPLRLMDFPEIVWPSALKSVRNWILANLIITPYFDRDFGIPDFIQGSKKALEVISECVSQNNFEQLRGLVDPEATRAVQRSISTFSVQQRQELSICQEDIYFCFPYQVGVMLSDDEDNPKRFVEITMCYHTLQGLNDMRNQGKTPPLNMGMMPEYRDKIFICNYRFIREYTKGVQDQWTVNVINHFKPSDYVT